MDIKQIRTILTVFILLTLTACASQARAGKPALPKPKSELFGEFVWQEDGDYGYSILRPSTWSSSPAFESRLYYVPTTETDQISIVLEVVNYQIPANTEAEDGVMGLFRDNPSIEGWTQARVNTWGKMGFDIQLLHSSEGIRIYSQSMGPGTLGLVAYIVKQDRPMAVALVNLSGDMADIELLKQNGIFDDFTTIVESIRMIPVEPGKTTPALPERESSTPYP